MSNANFLGVGNLESPTKGKGRGRGRGRGKDSEMAKSHKLLHMLPPISQLDNLLAKNVVQDILDPSPPKKRDNWKSIEISIVGSNRGGKGQPQEKPAPPKETKKVVEPPAKK